MKEKLLQKDNELLELQKQIKVKDLDLQEEKYRVEAIENRMKGSKKTVCNFLSCSLLHFFFLFFFQNRMKGSKKIEGNSFSRALHCYFLFCSSFFSALLSFLLMHYLFIHNFSF
jgi:hypothetical protein